MEDFSLKLWYQEGHIPTYKNTKKGFITVEAAIFLPVFIIGVLTIAYLIKFMSIQEGVFHTLTDESRVLSSEAVLNPVSIGFESKLKSRIYGEYGNNISDLNLENFRYLYANGERGMISMDLDYNINVKLPIPFYKTMPVSESLIFRGFVGQKTYRASIQFEEMEKEKESNIVWVFPRSGGRYHKESCTYISSKPREMLMSNSIRGRYESCSLCHSSNLKNGTLVYCFPKYGEAYHAGSCPTVDKYVISMEKEEAIEKGYTPCSKCGGE
jgi:hypothetical protein